MARTERRNHASGSKSLKARLSSDWSLKPDSMKMESLVIAGQLHGGEYVLGTCTHCPSRQGSQGHPKSRVSWPKVKLMTKMKSKQGSPRGIWGWITSFLKGENSATKWDRS